MPRARNPDLPESLNQDHVEELMEVDKSLQYLHVEVIPVRETQTLSSQIVYS